MPCGLGLEEYGTFIRRTLANALSNYEVRNLIVNGPGCREGVNTGTER